MKIIKKSLLTLFMGILCVGTIIPPSNTASAMIIYYNPYKDVITTPQNNYQITLSNYEVQQISKIVGLYGASWAAINAIAKKLGKSPTWINLMCVAIPTLGAAYINFQNKNNRGVIIEFVGPYLTPICNPR